MNDPSRVRVNGPLAPYAGGFRAALEAKGYAPATVAGKLQLAAQVSRWLEVKGLGMDSLTAGRIEEFFKFRRTKAQVLHVSPQSLRDLVEHLGDLGALPGPRPSKPSALDTLLERYRRYLLQERGLADGTVARYVYVAGCFLRFCSSEEDLDLGSVSATAAGRFVITECSRHTAQWVKAVAVALRSLLRFLYLEGLIEAPLAQAVPTPGGGVATSLPKALKPAELDALLGSCDRGSATGRRDYAVLLLLARLGLRAGEVAGLRMEDVDWRAGQIKVRGKGPRIDVLPLPAAVGRALAHYVTKGRPRVAGGPLFRRALAPYSGMDPVSVTGIVYRACERAELPHAGAHRLRHTAATAMLRGGASLPEIAQILRQRSHSVTALYARVDREALAAVAQPWPGARP
ncbi:MAG: tyrosine-type recombinase/integrase [Candidatus Dormibacteria bacterium]